MKISYSIGFFILGIMSGFVLNIFVSFPSVTPGKIDDTIVILRLDLSMSTRGEKAGGISVVPNEDSIALLFNYDTKTIGITNFDFNKKIKATEKYGSPEFSKIFQRLSLTTEETKKYPQIGTGILFYQVIKEADFDSFFILPGGYYAMDKNNVYALGLPDTSYTFSGNRKPMSPVDSLGNYHPYYIVMPPNIDRKKFQLFRNYFLVQKDGVYAFGKKFDQVAIPSRFIHDNTPEETPF